MPSPDARPASSRKSSLESLRDLERRMLLRYSADAGGERPATTLVFVLGAGASRASCLEEWKAFGESLVDDLSGHYFHGGGDAFLDHALTLLQPSIGPAPDPLKKKEFLQEKATPEQVLEVARRNTVFEKLVRDKLDHAYGRELAPQLGYELVAHLLRHRFIDHVVHFNWDEILDRAIEDEVGPSGYERVLPGGRAADSDRSRGLPRLFKLHGTASSPGSLRFTIAETGSLSPEMTEQLDESLFGIRPGKHGSELAPSRCHLVSFGYRWNDADFVNYVVSRWKLFERLTVVRISPHYPEGLERVYRQVHKKEQWEAPDGRGKIAIVSTEQLAVPGGKPLIDHVLWSLWELIQGGAQAAGLRLTPAARHILLGLYFAPRSDRILLPLVVEENDYLKDPGRLFKHDRHRRLQLEFLLHVMKCNGMINLSPMGRDPRIAGALASPGGAQPLYELLDDKTFFRPSPGSAMRETYFLTPAPRKRGRLVGKGSILSAAAATVAKAMEVERGGSDVTFRPVWAGNELTFQKVKLWALFDQCARQIFEADDVEVVAARDSRNDVLFVAPRALTSWARLSRESSLLLAEPWDTLLVIAESGRWIFKALSELEPKASTKQRQIFLVRTSDRDLEKWEIGGAYDVDIERQIEALDGRGIVTHSLAIPWWRHNRHMTLSLSRKGAGYALGKGIYFRRRLKDHRIAPVLVDDGQQEKGSDRFELLLLFLSYVARAVESYRTGASGALVDGLEQFADRLKEVVMGVQCRSARGRASRKRVCEEIDEKIGRLRLGAAD